MNLLPTQVSQIFAVIDDSPFERHEVIIDPADGNPILRFTANPYQTWFSIHGRGPFDLRMSPGERVHEEKTPVLNWEELLTWVAKWLRNIKRELIAAERIGSPSATTPDWALKELPAEYEQTVREIATLQETERRLRRMAGLLWETGEPLNKLVRDAFRDIGFDADLTAAAATYDVMVKLPNRRLLIEVTGIEGQVNKGSKKIAQVLNVQQTEAKVGDRACVAVNAYRDRHPTERDKLELVTPDALALLIGLDAVVFTTSDLFRLWKLSRTDADRSRQEVESLHVAGAGIVRLAR